MGVGCRSSPHNLDFQENSDCEENKNGIQSRMEERKWRLWKEKEEKILRECCVDEEIIEEIRILTVQSLILTDGFTDA